MEADSRSKIGIRVKADQEPSDVKMTDDKPTYRSWKKKYRKMRIVFDQKMHEGEELHRQEQKALATARRLAIQKEYACLLACLPVSPSSPELEIKTVALTLIKPFPASLLPSRLLDLLLDVNNSAQIPPEKRIDLSLDPPSDDDALCLDIDRPSTPPPGPAPFKSLRKLLQEVPHHTFAAAPERFPDLLADLEAGRDSPADPAQGQSDPPSFLTADDIDNYIWEIDTRLASEAAAAAAGKDDSRDGPPPLRVPSPALPTLAPLAHADRAGGGRDAQRDFALRNPTSVYNWLRKHAPKTFLQDGEHDRENGEDGHGPGSGRRGKGGGGGERAARGTGSVRSKRASAAHGRAAVASAAAAESFEDLDDEYGYGGGGAMTPSTVGAKGKRKRVVDDDPGYRPKGGSSRPAKKKRKSEGVEGTPTVKKPKKSAGVSGGGGDAALSREMEE